MKPYGCPAIRLPVPPGASETLWHAMLKHLGNLTDAAELEASVDHDGQVRFLITRRMPGAVDAMTVRCTWERER